MSDTRQQRQLKLKMNASFKSAVIVLCASGISRTTKPGFQQITFHHSRSSSIGQTIASPVLLHHLPVSLKFGMTIGYKGNKKCD